MGKVGSLFILGDSYSTFEGWIPEGYECWYYKNGRAETDVNKVEQTWWHQLIEATGANLVKNESYSGTLISHSGYNKLDYFKKSFVTRLNKVIEQGLFAQNRIDTVFIFGGTNDTWAETPIGKPQYDNWTTEDLYASVPAFCYLLHRVKEVAPKARIITIFNSDLKESLVEGCKEACERYGAERIELQNIEKENGHPNVQGMKQIFEQVLEYINA